MESIAGELRNECEQLRHQVQQSQAQCQELTARNAELRASLTLLEARYHALEAVRAQWVSLATTDGMTGLANHRAFQEELARQRARAERSRAPLSLLLLDVDHFKQYNDAFGHPAGDDVLQGVGELLRRAVREGDFPARYGGEEFAIVLPETDLDTALQIGERVRHAVAHHPFPNRVMSVSIGVTQFHAPETTDALIQRADVALYESKSAGRNRVTALFEEGETADRRQETGEEDTIIHIEHAGTGMGDTLMDSGLLSSVSCLPSSPPAWLGWAEQDGGIEGILQEPTGPLLSELLGLLDTRDDAPRGHSERVARYVLHLGRELANYYEEQRDTRPLLPRLAHADLLQMAYGALLHDIGKTGVPDAILHKTGKLNDEEWRQIRRHPLVGAAMLAQSPILSRAMPIVRFHHERWDGTGYPQGLAGDDIPLPARVFAVCDTLDILTNPKPYRPALSYIQARAEIERECGSQFDPDVVAAFVRIPEAVWHLPCAQPDLSALAA